MFTLRYLDTCSPDYLTDHHQREGEILLGVHVNAESTNATVCAGLIEAWQVSDVPRRAMSQADLEALTVDMWEGATGAEPWFDPHELPADESDDVQAWFLLKWRDEPAAPVFSRPFGSYVCEGDSIETTFGGFRFVATVYRDDCGDAPDERQDGFWPSLKADDPGFIGAKSLRTLARRTAEAQAVLDAWRRDDWFYCGVAVRAYIGETPVTDEYENAVWGIECNYPRPNARARDPNLYLLETANGLIGECYRSAKVKAAELAQAFAAVAS